MIGEAGLSAPSRPPLASDAYALWLDDLLRSLGLDRVSIVGVSLGGWLALDYATRRPERIERLAVLCPAGVGRQNWASCSRPSRFVYLAIEEDANYRNGSSAVRPRTPPQA